jgi:hypothetical protein
MNRTCSTHRREAEFIYVLRAKKEGKISLGIRRRKCEDNIKMDLR